MKKISIVSAASFIISCMALWFLMMPPTLYGILGCVVVFGVTCILIRRQQDIWMLIKPKFHIAYVAPIGLFCWVALQKFYERWIPSGVVASLADAIGTESKTLLLAVGILGILVALPVLFVAVEWVARTANKQKYKVVIGERASDKTVTESKEKVVWTDLLFFILLSLCIGVQFSLNPWSNVYPGSDSTVFLYIGQRMREGAVPYLDLFDHKGLLLYFIEYMGLCVGNGNFVGVWVLEIVNLFITALLFFKITGLFCDKKAVRYVAVALVLCTVDCYIAYEGGNLAEEYALPWISLALFIFLKYFMRGNYRFFEIVLLGVSFVAVLFLRVNMVAVWVAFLPVVLIEMIGQKKWEDIGKCVIGFLLGTLIGLVPFIGYCFMTGSLADMLRYYIGFNFGYSDSESGLLPVLSTAWFLFRQTAVWVAVILSTAWIFWKNRIWRLNLWFLGVTLVLAAMSGRLYYHYGMILLPAMLVPIILLLEKVGEHLNGKEEKYLIGLAGAFLIIQTGSSIISYTEPEKSEIATYIEENTAETDDILVLGNDCRYYLESGRNTANKFFYQTPPINVSDEIYEEFMAELVEEQPTVIVVIGEKDTLKLAENNLAEVCRTLDKWATEGRYRYTEGAFYGIYQSMEIE